MNQMTDWLRRGAVAVILSASAAVAMATPLQWTAATSPQDGNIAGAADETIGWGYSIANEDDSLWLILTAIAADSFQNASVTSLFDLPVIAPGSTTQAAYDGSRGLYTLTWDSAAPVGFVNFGTFILSAEWWDGDPLTSGVFVSEAEDVAINYSATVATAQPIPEPTTLWFYAIGLAVLLGHRQINARPRRY